MTISTPLDDPIPSAYQTDERLAIRSLARDFAMNEVLPIANELDPVQGEMPMDLRNKMAEMGFFGVLIPEEYGGLGLGLIEYALITEELARAWMSVASIIARGNGIGGGFSKEQCERILPKMAKGELLGAFALSEPGAGSDIASIRCRAERDGDQWVINGQKMWCTFADGADFIVLIARSKPYNPQQRHAGISRFYIEKKRGSLPEGIQGNPIRKIGYHGWKTWELSFDNFRIPAENILGGEDSQRGDKSGYDATARGLAVGRVHTAARAIGLARGALEDSISYAQQRVQFERPIGDFQAIRFKIAQMATDIEAARQLTYAVANDADNGILSPRAAAMAKLFASEMAERVTSEGIQIHGGAGYTTDFPLERYWRDARLTKIFEGTSEIQLHIISNTYLPRPGR